MPAKPRPSARSTNPNTSKNAQKAAPDRKDRKPARAHRDDTPEAKAQRERMPKTHPSSAGRQPAARKARKGDKE
jgi:hypothetical protein